MNFLSKDIKKINENIFKLFDNDWMLLTAGEENNFNTMTVSWGTMGILWNLPVAICFVRPQRHTLQFMQKSDMFTLCALPETMRDALSLCGSKSGRDMDKAKAAGLTPFVTSNKGIAFSQARMYVECRKIYKDEIKPSSFVDTSIIGKIYPKSDFHHIFLGEITGWYEKNNALKEHYI
jgi:flavin reductase (DIM6/NTAB) family NADH-FMN oxidoreductase RutF